MLLGSLGEHRLDSETYLAPQIDPIVYTVGTPLHVAYNLVHHHASAKLTGYTFDNPFKGRQAVLRSVWPSRSVWKQINDSHTAI